MHYANLIYLFLRKNIGGVIFLSILIYLLCRYKVSILNIIISCYVLYFVFYLLSSDHSLYSLHGYKKRSKIPSDIYTYWHSEKIPNTVKKCIQSWRKHCPGYTIHIINKKNIDTYALGIKLNPHITSEAFFSDMIRLHVLAERGGIWMDASVYLNKSLDWVHGYQSSTKCEFIGYDQKPYNNYSKVESWFFACIKNSRFVNDWKTEFFSIQNYKSIPDYIKEIESHGIDLNHLSNKEYLSVYVSSNKLLQRPHSYKIEVLDGNGPLSLYMVMVYPFYPLFYKEPVVKYVSLTRNIMEYTCLYEFI